MKNYLLPYRFKKIGLCMVVPFFAICLWCICSGEWEFSYMKWPCFSLFTTQYVNGEGHFSLISLETTDPINEIGMLGFLVSLCFIAFSREKDEDEMTAQVRMQSFVWSFWFTAILYAVAILFVHGTVFLTFSFFTMFIVFVVYIIKFNLTMLEIRREER